MPIVVLEVNSEQKLQNDEHNVKPESGVELEFIWRGRPIRQYVNEEHANDEPRNDQVDQVDVAKGKGEATAAKTVLVQNSDAAHDSVRV